MRRKAVSLSSNDLGQHDGAGSDVIGDKMLHDARLVLNRNVEGVEVFYGVLILSRDRNHINVLHCVCLPTIAYGNMREVVVHFEIASISKSLSIL
jgi:hypothetical protein